MIPSDGPHDRRGEHIEARYGRRARLSLLDFQDFAWLAADLVSRGKAAYAGDVQLRLAAEAIIHKLGESVPGCRQTWSTHTRRFRSDS